jgi:hypothetical protein
MIQVELLRATYPHCAKSNWLLYDIEIVREVSLAGKTLESGRNLDSTAS